MSYDEAIREIADILEVEDDEVITEKELDMYDSWDSIAILSVISVISENTGRFLHASEIEKLGTVQDLIDVLIKD